jgi:hypothetical protein
VRKKGEKVWIKRNKKRKDKSEPTDKAINEPKEETKD